ncbi:bifunctional nicotinamidase/pyrazinamidase [Cyclobacterium jeungdonense]|uniref:nicotinamidase n=1 Tax=Cyclobacterium jeungdonense TaxID=708087 RepID=A0ABT8C131_9BACT|nr:bifunctional nicotinamidase/pyrazinamidase [Cyclobacterium jeungdonense]MDN3686411.1 bifunctional nicotinamidase/pyrazinamidase [Cyclobacterium jeungdonense]
MEIDQVKSALLIVDVQNDFLPGGALAVAEGDTIVAVINELQEKFSFIVATQDWHPRDHGSFAANHPGKNIGEFIDLEGVRQILWPVHCVQGTHGAAFHPDLNTTKWRKIFQKGTNPKVDSYSGFFDNNRKGDTGLGNYLKNNGISRVFIVGLAADYCVKYTVLDSLSLGFESYLVADATKGVNLSPEDTKLAIKEMKNEGAYLIESKALF